MIAVIHPEFKKHFDELEAFHLDLNRRLIPWTYEGLELLTQLTKERQAFAPVRLSLMDRLAEIALPFTGEVRAGHQAYIRQTKYYKIVQEAPFYRRIMNKPEGYAGDAEMMNIIYRDQYEGERHSGCSSIGTQSPRTPVRPFGTGGLFFWNGFQEGEGGKAE